MLHNLETLLTWAVLFGILIFVHELGHFLAAKLFKFKVYEFAFGLPFGKKWRYWYDGETEYTIRAVLLGGFVGFAEADADDETREKQMAFFNAKPIWQRFLVILAGPVASFLLGWLAFVVLVGVQGVELPGPQKLRVVDGGAAAMAGLRSDDLLINIAGKPVNDFNGLVKQVQASEGKSLDIEVLRDDKPLTLVVQPREQVEGKEKTYKIGVSLRPRTRPAQLGEVLGEANRMTGTFLSELKKLVGKPRELKKNVGGPIAIAGAVSDVVKWDWEDRLPGLLGLMGQLSLSLYAANLFIPIPVFDGGQIVLLIIEAIRRKQLSKELQMGVALTGWALVLVLFVSITFNDILKLLGRG
ncbi:M50 family metallopeptidase [Armatimonas sp.]|uniref:M50 family metallopeptidase n=1 Tax=Armatimonas sp. TaxID=1872638 RepID=UPI00286CD988|nr:M50 family metallopeptidase [Armatimonas sp.]